MSNPATKSDETIYAELEDAIGATPQGRWFLDEYAKRNAAPSTDRILTRLDELQRAWTKTLENGRIDYLRRELHQMAASIMEARREIAAIKPREGEDNRIMAATEELDAIVSSTERATSEILAAAERIQDIAEKLKTAGADAALCEELEHQSIAVFTACSFQDITGQRTNKVVQVLRYLEARVNAMVQIWEGSGEVKPAEAAEAEDSRPDAHLLNGPQDESVAISQDEIDRMLTDEATSATPAPSAEASQDDIDALFDEPSAA